MKKKRTTPLEITVLKNGQNIGPFTQDELKNLIRKGTFDANDLAWHEGLENWQPIVEIVPISPNNRVPKLFDAHKYIFLGAIGLALLISILGIFYFVLPFAYARKIVSDFPPDDKYSAVVEKYWNSTYGDRRSLIFRSDQYEEVFAKTYEKLSDRYEVDSYKNDLWIRKKMAITASSQSNEGMLGKHGWRVVSVESTYINKKNRDSITNKTQYLLQERSGKIGIEWEATKKETETWKGWDYHLHPRNWQNNPLSIYGQVQNQHFIEGDNTRIEIIENFPENVRGNLKRLSGYFGGFDDTYVQNIEGVTLQTNGLLSRINVSEKEKWLGFRFQEASSNQVFHKCFAPKKSFGSSFLTFSSNYGKETPIDVLGVLLPLDLSGGDLGFFCVSVAFYDIWTGKWEINDIQE